MPTNNFSRVLISKEAIEQFKESLKQTKGELSDEQVGELIRDKFLGSSKGLNPEKLETPGRNNIFSGRVNDKSRFYWVHINQDGEQVPLIFACDPNHDYKPNIYGRYANKEPEPELVDGAYVAQLNCTKTIVAPQTDLNNRFKIAKPALLFSDDQDRAFLTMVETYQKEQTFFLNSVAGAGKTGVAIRFLSQLAEQFPEDLEEQPEQLLYVTMSPVLAKQQEELFAKLHPNLAAKVQFITYEQLLIEQAEPGQDLQTIIPADPDGKEPEKIISHIATFEHFSEWYQKEVGVDKTKLFNGRKYPAPRELYDEFWNLGNYENLQSYQQATDFYCRYQSEPASGKSPEIIRADVVELYRKYQNYLVEAKLLDPTKIRLREDLALQQQTTIVFDEAQYLNYDQCQQLKKVSKSVQYCGDSNQGPTGFRPAYLDDQLTQLRLTNNHRLPDEVANLASLVLARINSLGRRGDADFQIQSSGVNKGEVDWRFTAKEYDVAKDLGRVITDLNQQNRAFLVVVSNQALKKKVAEAFPGITVLTAIESNGVECETVIMYGCLYEDSKGSDAAKTTTPGSKIKDKSEAGIATSLKALAPLRLAFLAMTRAKENLIIVNAPSSLAENLKAEFQAQFATQESASTFISTRAIIPERSKAAHQQGKDNSLSTLSVITNYINSAALLYESRPDECKSQIQEAAKIICDLPKISQTNIEKELIEALLNKLIIDHHQLLSNNLLLCKTLVGDTANLDQLSTRIAKYKIFLTDGLVVPEGIPFGLKIGDQTVYQYVLATENEKLITDLLQKGTHLPNLKSENIDLADPRLSASSCELLLEKFNPILSRSDVKILLGRLSEQLEESADPRTENRAKVILNYLMIRKDQHYNHMKKELMEFVQDSKPTLSFLRCFDLSVIIEFSLEAVKKPEPNQDLIFDLLRLGNSSLFEEESVLKYVKDFLEKDDTSTAKFIELLKDFDSEKKFNLFFRLGILHQSSNQSLNLFPSVRLNLFADDQLNEVANHYIVNNRYSKMQRLEKVIAALINDIGDGIGIWIQEENSPDAKNNVLKLVNHIIKCVDKGQFTDPESKTGMIENEVLAGLKESLPKKPKSSPSTQRTKPSTPPEDFKFDPKQKFKKETYHINKPVGPDERTLTREDLASMLKKNPEAFSNLENETRLPTDPEKQPPESWESKVARDPVSKPDSSSPSR